MPHQCYKRISRYLIVADTESRLKVDQKSSTQQFSAPRQVPHAQPSLKIGSCAHLYLMMTMTMTLG